MRDLGKLSLCDARKVADPKPQACLLREAELQPFRQSAEEEDLAAVRLRVVAVDDGETLAEVKELNQRHPGLRRQCPESANPRHSAAKTGRSAGRADEPIDTGLELGCTGSEVGLPRVRACEPPCVEVLLDRVGSQPRSVVDAREEGLVEVFSELGDHVLPGRRHGRGYRGTELPTRSDPLQFTPGTGLFKKTGGSPP